MATQKRTSLRLTTDQQATIKKLTGRDAEALDLTVEELEERIAPTPSPPPGPAPGGPVLDAFLTPPRHE